jgi:hypothetical protein
MSATLRAAGIRDQIIEGARPVTGRSSSDGVRVRDVINLKAVTAVDLTIPLLLLVRADQAIE